MPFPLIDTPRIFGSPENPVMTTDAALRMQVGEEVTVEVTAVAHGGHCIARHGGQVLFVRHCLPGERVRARVTDAPQHGRFVRADTTEVIDPSPHRVSAPCAFAGTCGGCDWQHASLDFQRQLKADVVREQLIRLGGESQERWSGLSVEPVPGDDHGLFWRTRMRFAVDANGQAGLRAHRSHDVVLIDQCAIAAPGITELGVTHNQWPGCDEVLAVAPAASRPISIADPKPGMGRVREIAANREWHIDATAFWQVHPGAADTFIAAVRQMLDPRPGEHILDLYAGVGLFAVPLAEDVGVQGRVDAVESDPVALRGAKRACHNLAQVRLHESRVEAWLTGSGVKRCDAIVLDPPRTGAGRKTMAALIALSPRAIVYVACDPAALARDIAEAKKLGWHLEKLRAFDAFPMTHHVECIALLRPGN